MNAKLQLISFATAEWAYCNSFDIGRGEGDGHWKTSF